jgi:IS30 family transposase
MPWSASRSCRRWFWRRVRAGDSWAAAAASAGVSLATMLRWRREGGGMPPLSLTEPSRELTITEREGILAGLSQGLSYAAIGRELGRSTSTITRELNVNRLVPDRPRAEPNGRERPRTGRPRRQLNYSPSIAQARADARKSRPKTSKLTVNPALREQVQTRLGQRHSPEQIAGRLRLDFPNDPEMWVSHETIYQSLYVQGKGALHQELTRCLRTGRALRQPRRRQPTPTPRNGGVSISERPPEAADRALPGHFEGDLIIGAGTRSAIATVVERRSRFTLLGHLPGGHTAENVADALVASLQALPDQLKAHTLTWDQGCEMARHAHIAFTTGVQVFFCDPASPWQRPSNENTVSLVVTPKRCPAGWCRAA